MYREWELLILEIFALHSYGEEKLQQYNFAAELDSNLSEEHKFLLVNISKIKTAGALCNLLDQKISASNN